MPPPPAVSTHRLDRLGLEAEQLQHRSGLVHLHLPCDDPHRAAVLAFRTRADDDRGLPHALEHLVLCGSERYPVRDPFFGMLRRSIHSAWNAQTGDQSTEYLFATGDPVDFANLLAVMLDACFHPLLAQVDVDREIWRYDPAADELAGVVLNEVRGIGSEPAVILEQATCARLLADTSLRFDAGGCATRIPDLTRDDLLAAHRRWYRPGNALLVTYGALDRAAIAAALDAALRDVTDPEPALPPPALQQRRAIAPATVAVPLDDESDPRDARLASLVWLWGDARDLRTTLLGELLAELLIGNAAAPLRCAIEGSGLVRGLDPGGLIEGARSLYLSLPCAGLREGAEDELRALVRATMERIAEVGFGRDAVEAARRRVAFSRRCIGDEGTAFGLDLALRCCTAWSHGGEPLTGIDDAAAIADLLAADPAALEAELIAAMTALEPCWTTTRPDPEWETARREDARQRCRRARTDDAADWSERAAAVEAWHRNPDGHDGLPRLRRAQLDPAPPANGSPQWSHTVACYRRPCVGLVHQLAVLPLPELTPEQWRLLPIFTALLGQLGCADQDYRERARRVAARCGWRGAWYELRCDPHDPGRTRGAIVLATSGLAEDWRQQVGLDAEVWRHQRWDEVARVAELLARREQQLAEALHHDGQGLAAAAAARGLPGPAGLRHDSAGLGHLAWLRRADASELAAACGELHRSLAGIVPRTALIADEDPTAMAAATEAAWGGCAVGAAAAFALSAGPPPEPSAWMRPGEVNDLARLWPGPPLADPDAAALALAVAHLGEVELHRGIREAGGAYAAGARYRPRSATIEATSGDDPHLERSLDCIAQACTGLAERELGPDELEAAALVAYAASEPPPGAVDRARRDHLDRCLGWSEELVGAHRRRLLTLEASAVRAAAARWLGGEERIAAIAAPEAVAASDRQWRRHRA